MFQRIRNLFRKQDGSSGDGAAAKKNIATLSNNIVNAVEENIQAERDGLADLELDVCRLKQLAEDVRDGRVIPIQNGGKTDGPTR